MIGNIYSNIMNIRLTIISSIVLLTAFICGCGNSSRAGYGSAASYDEAGEDYEVVDADTTIEDSMEMDEARGGAPVVLGAHSSYEAQDDDDYDNMRGFDPASEDDMDDNGMSRYMENDDEEGYD